MLRVGASQRARNVQPAPNSPRRRRLPLALLARDPAPGTHAERTACSRGNGSNQNGFDTSSRIFSPYVRPDWRRSPEVSSTMYWPCVADHSCLIRFTFTMRER
jgi:hypothetical protein